MTLKRAAVIASTICALTSLMLFTGEVPPQRLVGLTVESHDLALGVIPEQPDFQRDLPITNISDVDIDVDDVRTSCKCTSVNPRRLSIPAGGTAKIHLTMNMLASIESSRNERPFSIEIRPIIHGGNWSQPIWELKGRIQSPYSLSPTHINFGSVVTGAEHQEKSAVVECIGEVSDLTAECASPYINVHVVRDNENEKPLFHVFVSLKSGMPLGSFREFVMLSSCSASHGPQKGLPLEIRGEVTDDVFASPNQIFLGPAEVGSTVTQELTLSRRSGEPVIVEDVLFSATDDISIERQPIVFAGSVSFKVIGNVPGTGEKRTHIRFKIKGTGDQPPALLLVEISSFGIPSPK